MKRYYTQQLMWLVLTLAMFSSLLEAVDKSASSAQQPLTITVEGKPTIQPNEELIEYFSEYDDDEEDEEETPATEEQTRAESTHLVLRLTNYYTLLKVEENASFYEIDRAYNRLKEKHKDDSTLLKKLEKAHETLISQNKREAYDKALERKEKVTQKEQPKNIRRRRKGLPRLHGRERTRRSPGVSRKGERMRDREQRAPRRQRYRSYRPYQPGERVVPAYMRSRSRIPWARGPVRRRQTSRGPGIGLRPKQGQQQEEREE